MKLGAKKNIEVSEIHVVVSGAAEIRFGKFFSVAYTNLNSFIFHFIEQKLLHIRSIVFVSRLEFSIFIHRSNEVFSIFDANTMQHFYSTVNYCETS